MLQAHSPSGRHVPPPEADSHMQELIDSRRMHERVRQYWLSIKDNRPFPSEKEVDPMAISDVWDHCFLVNMRSRLSSGSYRYEYMGSALLGAYGLDMAGIESCDAARFPHLASMLRHFDEVAESGEPAVDESIFANANGVRISYRCCLLPLGGDHVEYILGCMRWKET